MLDAPAIVHVLLDAEELPPAGSEPAGNYDSQSARALINRLDKPVTFAAPPVPNYYASLRAQLGKRPRKKIDRNTYLEDRGNNSVGIVLHGTTIIHADADGTITVNTGGWETHTTKDRLNKFLPAGWGIYQVNHKWYWYNTATRMGMWDNPSDMMVPFTRFDKILPDGSLLAQQSPISRKLSRRRR